MNIKTHIALLGGLLLGGCTLSEDQIETDIIDELDEPASPSADPADEGEIASQPEESVPAYLNIIPAECIGAPVVAILEDAEEECNRRGLPPNWIWNPMFDTGSPDTTAITLPVPDELQKYCMFEYVGQQKLGNPEDYAPILQYIDSHPGLSLNTTGADCMGFQPMANTLADPDLAKLMAEAFMLNIDAPDANDIWPTVEDQRPVTLEVIDSVSQYAFDNGIAPFNRHGIFMKALIDGIACPFGGHCAEYNHLLLGMPRADYQLPDWVVGEAYASKVDIAIQIYAAVQAWRERKLNNDPTATDRLVLNISLGYQRVNAGNDDFTRGPQASLKAALDFASCHGALVFAASGNVRDENCPENEDGALAPAAFEGILAPDADECHAMGFDPDWEHDFPIFKGDRPLLYAVSGVDAFDELLPNSRKNSRAALAAIGSNGIGADMSQALTGTSVSAAVASATAKLIWSYNPELRPDEVYAAMWNTGWDLGVHADFGLVPGTNSHRLSVCAALREACDGLGHCPALNCSAQAPASDGNLGGFFQAVDDVLSDPGTVVKEYDGHGASATCEVWQPTELVTPQPELPICAYCGADVMSGANNDKLYMSIDPAYVGMVTDVVLLLKDNMGVTTAVTMDPEVVASLNDTSIGVVQVNFNAPAVTKAATLSFSLGAVGQSNPVVVRYYY